MILSIADEVKLTILKVLAWTILAPLALGIIVGGIMLYLGMLIADVIEWAFNLLWNNR